MFSCLSCVGEEDSSLVDDERSTILELPALPYKALITAISGCQNIDYIVCTVLSNGFAGR